eukprot:CAMPEP_0117422108 /NCGR_PEP_ID=MMETSP0758-20121206/3014_1 /TAXON_ID=63605 /ORGANISM="Percolomonas cosmopolitus, Strain AE-1 (ATCC 50343)" /LENGTH=687 /DNA_ID=CAMNT_0005204531 /DNA_START=383 /DNA_END=2443 /DNA_ORIENTATION=-
MSSFVSHKHVAMIDKQEITITSYMAAPSNDLYYTESEENLMIPSNLLLPKDVKTTQHLYSCYGIKYNTILSPNTSENTVPSSIEASQLSSKVVMDTLNILTEKLGVPYCLDKMDLIPIEGLDAFGSENLGCMLFGSEFFFVDNNTVPSRKRRIVRMMIHETTHQWIGNLVSLRYWNDFWIKEGLTRYVEYVLVDEFFPKWNYWHDYLISIFFSSMQANTKIKKPVYPNLSVNQINSTSIDIIFDAMVAYGRGSAIIRMFAHYIGMPSIWPFLRKYVKHYSWQTVTTNDLIHTFSSFVLDESERVAFESLFQQWVKYDDVPCLLVEYVSNHAYSITQLQSHPIAIPLLLSFLDKDGRMRQKKIILKDKLSSIRLPQAQCLFINLNHTGYFKTCYDETCWTMICQQMLPHLNQVTILGLLHDIFCSFEDGLAHQNPVVLMNAVHHILCHAHLNHFHLTYLIDKLPLFFPMIHERELIQQIVFKVRDLAFHEPTNNAFFDFQSIFRDIQHQTKWILQYLSLKANELETKPPHGINHQTILPANKIFLWIASNHDDVFHEIFHRCLSTKLDDMHLKYFYLSALFHSPSKFDKIAFLLFEHHDEFPDHGLVTLCSALQHNEPLSHFLWKSTLHHIGVSIQQNHPLQEKLYHIIVTILKSFDASFIDEFTYNTLIAPYYKFLSAMFGGSSIVI